MENDGKSSRVEMRAEEDAELNEFLVRFWNAAREVSDSYEIASTVCQLVVEKLGVERAYWAELDWATRDYVIGASFHVPQVSVIDGRFPLDAWEPFTSFHLAGMPVVVNDTQTDSRIPAAVKEGYAKIEVGADLAAPVIHGGQLRCTLAVNQRLPREWTQQEVALIREVGRWGWAEVERARSETTQRESAKRQAFLLKFSDTLRGEEGAEKIEQVALDLLAAHLSTDRAYITTSDYGKGETAVPAEVRRADLPALLGVFLHSDYPESARLVNEGTLVIDDVATTPQLSDPNRASFDAIRIGSLIGVGLRKGMSDIFWTMAVAMIGPRKWTLDEIWLVEQVAERTFAALTRAKTEAALRESIVRFRALVTTGADSTYRMSPDWRLMYQLDSDALANTTAPIENWADKYILEEDRPRVFAAIDTAICAKSLFELEHRVRLADGSVGWVLSRAVPLFDENGEFSEWFGSGRNVTARKLAEAALREIEDRHRSELERQVQERTAELQQSRDLLQATMDSSEDMIQVFEAVRDAQGVIVDFRWVLNNHTSERHYGEVRGESLLERNPGVVEVGIFETFKQVVETGIPNSSERHYVHEQFNGWFYQSAVKLGDGVATSTKDITRWKQAQEELLRLRDEVAQALLRESEQNLHGVANVVPDLLWYSDPDGSTPWYNDRWLEYTGQTLEQASGWGWVDVIHPDDREGSARRYREAIEQSKPLHQEHRIRRHTGEYRWFLVRFEPLLDVAGRATRVYGAATDIHDQRLAMEAMRDSEERFRLFVENVREYALVQTDFEGVVTSWNPGAERLFGYNTAEVVGQPFSMLLPEEDRHGGIIAREMATLSLGNRNVDARMVQRKDGSRFWAEWVTEPVRDDVGKLRGTAKVMRDETDRQRAELATKSSLAEKEELLKEVHHRVKNNLQVITSLVSLQSKQIQDERIQVLFDETRNRIYSIAAIHERLYRSANFAEISLLAYAREIVPELIRFYGAAGRVHVVFQGAEASLELERAVPFALLLNELVSNALKHAFATPSQGLLRIEITEEGETTRMVVTDNGPGLPAGFELTKTSSLGLKLSKRLAGQLGGNIAFYTSAGTVVEVQFPRVKITADTIGRTA